MNKMNEFQPFSIPCALQQLNELQCNSYFKPQIVIFPDNFDCFAHFWDVETAMQKKEGKKKKIINEQINRKCVNRCAHYSYTMQSLNHQNDKDDELNRDEEFPFGLTWKWVDFFAPLYQMRFE